MKLKKYLIPIILFMMLLPTVLYATAGEPSTTPPINPPSTTPPVTTQKPTTTQAANTNCNDNQITIQSVTMQSKNGEAVETAQPTIQGKKINLNVTMSNVGDYIKYNIVIRNDSEEDYEFGNLGSSSNYITYSYDFSDNSNIVKAGTTKTVSLKVEYKNEVPVTAFVNGAFEDDKELEINLSTDVGQSNNTTTTTAKAKDEVKNPNTGVDASLLFIIVTAFVSGLLYLIFNKSKTIKHLVIVIGVLIVLPLTVYATCSCKISVDSKVTIEYNDPTVSIDVLKNNIVTTGEGLYEDANTSSRYVYKGKNPKNYFEIDDVKYRILSIEPDNTLKLIRVDSIGTLPFDAGYTTSLFNGDNHITSANSTNGTRYGRSGNDLCYIATNNNYAGCKVWGGVGSTAVLVNGAPNTIVNFPKILGSTLYNLPEDDAYLNVHLNGGMYADVSLTGWYSSLGIITQSLITDHFFYIGPVGHEENQTVQTDISQEKEYLWYGKVGLMNISDYVLASSNTACTGVYSYANSQTCFADSANH